MIFGVLNLNIFQMQIECNDTPDTISNIIESGVEIVEKLDKLEKTWPSLMKKIIGDILLDFVEMDSYKKRELKRIQDFALLHSKK